MIVTVCIKTTPVHSETLLLLRAIIIQAEQKEQASDTRHLLHVDCHSRSSFLDTTDSPAQPGSGNGSNTGQPR